MHPQTPRQWAKEKADHFAPGLIRLDMNETPIAFLDPDEAAALGERLLELAGVRTGIPIVDVEVLDLDLDDLVAPRGFFGDPEAAKPTDVIPAGDTHRVVYEAAEGEQS